MDVNTLVEAGDRRKNGRIASVFSLTLNSSDASATVVHVPIIKDGMCLISRVGSISRWSPHWIYYNLRAYISHKMGSFCLYKDLSGILEHCQ